MIGLMTSAQLGEVAFKLIQHDMHQPIVNGKCDRDSIDEALTVGILSGQVAPMNQDDVDFLGNFIDDLIEQFAA